MRDGIGRYDGTSIVLHWVTALLVFTQVAFGVAMVGIGKGPAQDLLFNVHKSMGVTLLLLVLARIAWRLTHPWPPFPDVVPPAQARLARTNHVLLYAVLLVMAVSGFVFTAAGGYPIPYLGIIELSGLVPKNEAFSKAVEWVHVAGQWVVYALVLLHVAGALYHLLVRRDGVFRRMIPSGRTVGQG